MTPAELTSIMNYGGVAGVFAVFAILMTRMMVKNHRDDMRTLMSFLRDERIQRDRIMNEANAVMKELISKIETIGKDK